MPEIAQLRRLFPFFGQKQSDYSAYLDNAATTHKSSLVIHAMQRFYEQDYGTVHRGLYKESEEATRAYEAVRDQVAQFIGASSPQEIVFTRGTTESINLFAYSWAEQQLCPGDEILLSQAEHHANLVPWQRVAQETGARLVFLSIDTKTYHIIDPEKYLSSRTKIVSIAHHSNVLGALWEEELFKSFVRKAQGLGAVVMVDVAQCLAHHAINLNSWGVDALAFSGHKLFAPTGVGVLYVKKKLHDLLRPYQLGGGMVAKVSWESSIYKEFPLLCEAGTPAIAEVLGLGAALKFMRENVDYDLVHKHESALTLRAYEGLVDLMGCRLFVGEEQLEQGAHLLSFSIEGMHAHDIAAFCAEKQVAVRAGNHCAQPLVNTVLGQDSLVRASFALYSTEQEADLLVEAVRQAVSYLS